MLYIVIGIALFCLTLKGYCGKRLSCFVDDAGDTYLFNFLRMVFCILIGAALVFFEVGAGFIVSDAGMLLICALSGFSNAAFLVGWMLAIQRNSMVSVDVALTLGSLIPSVLCMLLFSEPMSLLKMIGFALILLATFILAGHNKKTKGGGLIGTLLLVFAAVGDGISGFAQQLYKQYYTDAGGRSQGIFYPKTVYHFYTYVFAALILLIVLVFYRMRHARSNSEKKGLFSTSPRALLHIFIMAICLFAANYFQTVATNDYGMSSQMLYPIIKGGCLITVNFTAALCFGEKLTLRCVLGSLVALGGIISMSVL